MTYADRLVDYSNMSDRDLLVYLATITCNLPERVARLETWQNKMVGAMIMISSSTFIAIGGLIVKIFIDK